MFPMAISLDRLSSSSFYNALTFLLEIKTRPFALSNAPLVTSFLNLSIAILLVSSDPWYGDAHAVTSLKPRIRNLVLHELIEYNSSHLGGFPPEIGNSNEDIHRGIRAGVGQASKNGGSCSITATSCLIQ